MAMHQMGLFPTETTGDANERDTSSTFTANLPLPIHRWFRYSAGFSAIWARELIEEQSASGRKRVLDPFSGSGTALLEAERAGVEAIGIEAHPFMARVASAKLLWRTDPKGFRAYAHDLLKQAKAQGGTTEGYPSLISRCFPGETLARLDALKRAWAARADGSPHAELAWLALASIIRECSPVGTAQWQYVLPNKTKAGVAEPSAAFAAKVQLIAGDMARRQLSPSGPRAILKTEDARDCASIADEWADLVITSPPYANNYDYADATRLEMTFFGEVQGWGDLQRSVRTHLIPSCTQHVATRVRHTHEMIADPLLARIQPELIATCRQLEAEREEHGGRKPYHTMIAAYFQGMAQVWAALRRVTRRGAMVCFVIGDSAPYGVHVPVERWLGELALAAGFANYEFEKTRDRNVKWKNRKHRVPLHEGRLWVRG